MAKIEVSRLSREALEKMGVFGWPVWEKAASEFPWHYDEKESCYILEGMVEVKTKEGVTGFTEGDFVVFPAGLDCEWKIIRDVRKHYKFG
ncbi:MAG: cupin domain-containing protein [Planctomycetes bacterium]|nr:cupin domain-containing protein [Planctomycetota bacterium]